MNKRVLKPGVLIVAIAFLVALLAAACGGGEPEDLEIPVKLEHEKLDPETIKVKQGDMVTLKIEADGPGEFHLHGYDIEQDVGAGEVTDFFFEADTTGRFKITFHSLDEGEHGKIFQSAILEPGDSFAFQVPHHLEGETIPYHSHLHPETSGSIHISDDAPAYDQVSIEIRDMAVHPAETTTRPGTTIIWTNNDSVSQTVHSGHHEGMSSGGHEEEGKEETGIGILEVRPR